MLINRTGRMASRIVMCIVLVAGMSIAEELWQKTYGGAADDEAWSVAATADGGCIVAGSTKSFGAGEEDLYLVKLSSSGETAWTRAYGGSLEEVAYAVMPVSDGYVAAGYAGSFKRGRFDGWLVRTNAKGDTVWARCYGGNSYDIFKSVAPAGDGFIAAGHTRSFGAGDFDFYVVRTKANGDTLWTRSYGGSAGEHANCVCPTADGGFILAGSTASYGAGGDAWLVRINSKGDTLWTHDYGGSADDCANSVLATADGGFVFAGSTRSFGAGGEDVWLVRTNAKGDTVWTRTFGGAGWDWAASVALAPDGGFVVAGTNGSQKTGGDEVWLIKTDANGVMQWNRLAGGALTDNGLGVCCRPGGYFVAGATSSKGAGEADAFVLRTDASGRTRAPQK